MTVLLDFESTKINLIDIKKTNCLAPLEKDSLEILTKLKSETLQTTLIKYYVFTYVIICFLLVCIYRGL
jgi:hypothetical protein